MFPSILPSGYTFQNEGRGRTELSRGNQPVFAVHEVADRFFVQEWNFHEGWMPYRVFERSEDAWQYIDQIWDAHRGQDD